jgi:hypothetical protein
VPSFPVKSDTNGFGIPFVVFEKSSGGKGKPTPVLYAGVSSAEVGLYRSLDAGATWKPVPGQAKGEMPSHAEFDNTGALFLSYANGVGPGERTTGAIWKYEPKKEAWLDITPLAPSEGDKFGYGAVTVDVQHPGGLLAVTLDRWTKGDEVFRTSDGGKHWAPLIPKAERDTAGAEYLHWHRPGKVGPPGWDGDVDIDPFDSNHAMHVTGQGTWATNDLTEPLNRLRQRRPRQDVPGALPRRQSRGCERSVPLRQRRLDVATHQRRRAPIRLRRSNDRRPARVRSGVRRHGRPRHLVRRSALTLRAELGMGRSRRLLGWPRSGSRASRVTARAHAPSFASAILFVKTFPDLPKSAQAPREAEIELYADGAGAFVEVEQQGPYVEFPADQSSRWVVHWTMRRVPPSVQRAAFDPGLAALARAVAAEVRGD